MSHSEPTLAFMVDNDDPGADLVGRIHGDRAAIRERLAEHGAVLLRGFDIGGVDGFDAVVEGVSGGQQ